MRVKARYKMGKSCLAFPIFACIHIDCTTFKQNELSRYAGNAKFVSLTQKIVYVWRLIDQ